jgi:TPP-dependent pyruvate/acetoin dehydrogenase alpha subunit
MTAGGGLSAEWDRLLAPLLRARRFDEVLVENADLVTGVFHVSIGMEATAAALSRVRTREDAVMLGHRNHGHLVALGSDPAHLYRELLGRDGGPQRGRGGSLHLADPGNGVPYTSAMLGGGAAVANGLALAKRHRQAPGIVFAFFGDGAMGEGIVFEALGLARAWLLPIVFVCESNAPAGSPEGVLAALADAHGVPAAAVDARKPRDTLRALETAATSARGGAGPRFLEARSEPWPGNATFIPHPAGTLELERVGAPAADAFEAGDPVRAEAGELLAGGIPIERVLELDSAIGERMAGAFEQACRAPLTPAEVAVEAVLGADR